MRTRAGLLRKGEEVSRPVSLAERYRVKMSKLGLQCLNPKDPERQGDAWPHPSVAGLVRIRWDGAKYAMTYSDTFIDRVRGLIERTEG